jgi:hypothetical protein
MSFESLNDFVRGEFAREAESGFAIAGRIPDMRVKHFLDYYASLGSGEQDELADACAMRGAVWISGGAGAPYLDTVNALPAWKKWMHESVAGVSRDPHFYYSALTLRDYLGQIKADTALGRPVSVPLDWVDYAKTVHAVKTPELRKRLRAAMTKLYGGGLTGVTNKNAEYDGSLSGARVRVGFDLGSRYHQLGYEVAVDTTDPPARLSRAGYETALGLGLGKWDFIVDENVEESIALLSRLILHVADMPKRMPPVCLEFLRPETVA